MKKYTVYCDNCGEPANIIQCFCERCGAVLRSVNPDVRIEGTPHYVVNTAQVSEELHKLSLEVRDIEDCLKEKNKMEDRIKNKKKPPSHVFLSILFGISEGSLVPL